MSLGWVKPQLPPGTVPCRLGDFFHGLVHVVYAVGNIEGFPASFHSNRVVSLQLIQDKLESKSSVVRLESSNYSLVHWLQQARCSRWKKDDFHFGVSKLEVLWMPWGIVKY